MWTIGKDTGGAVLTMVLTLLCFIHANARVTFASGTGQADEPTSSTSPFSREELPSIEMSSSRNCTNDESCSNETEQARTPRTWPVAWLLSEEFPPKFVTPVYGYLLPCVVLVTVVVNSLLCFVLLKKEMRSPTNAVLVAIAISDMLTGLFPLPVCIMFYASDRIWEYIPFEWCSVIFHLDATMPDLFHTASIWLTLTLGVQRYICVCHPLKAKIWCSMKKTLRWIGTIFLMAFVSHLYLVLRLKAVPVDRPSAVDANKNVTGCYWETFVKDVDTLRPLKEAYTWYHAILINIIPCVTLLVMNVLLIRTMRQAEKRRVELSCQSRRRESRRLKESTSTTLMLVIVVSLFLLVEIPNGVYYICSSISATYNLAWYVIDVVVIFLNILVFLNNPFIFMVYCTMSKKFRNSLKQLFTSSSATEHQNDVTSPANRRTGVTS